MRKIMTTHFRLGFTKFLTRHDVHFFRGKVSAPISVSLFLLQRLRLIPVVLNKRRKKKRQKNR